MTQPFTGVDHGVSAPADAVATDWTVYQVPTLAAFLTDSLDPAQEQVGAWNTAHDTIAHAATYLASARAALAELWPPEHSQAAATYFQYVDELITSMRETADAAIANRNALNSTLDALRTAKTNIDSLHSEWTAYAAHTDAIGVGNDEAAALTGDNWAQDLNVKARQQMASADDVIFDSTRSLIVPVVFQAGIVDYIPRPVIASSTQVQRTPTSVAQSNAGVTNSDDAIGSPILMRGPGEHGSLRTSTGVGHPSPIGLDSTPAASPGVVSLPGTVPPGASRPPVGATSRGIDAGEHTDSSNRSSIDDAMHARTRSAADTATTHISEFETGSSASDVVSVSGVDNTRQGASMFAPGMAGRLSESETRRNRRPVRRELWRLPAGVPEVIHATTEFESHDPGPGVIGIDR